MGEGMKQAIDIVKDELEKLRVEKRQCKRYSAGWHRIDGAQSALSDVLWLLKFHV